MKFKTTRKEMCNCSFCIISFPYCDIQNIEKYLTPIAYTSGVYGWNCDIYEPTSYNIQFTTGYRPFEYYYNSEAKKLGPIIKEKILKLEQTLKSSNVYKLPLLEAQKYVQGEIFGIIRDSYKEIEKMIECKFHTLPNSNGKARVFKDSEGDEFLISYDTIVLTKHGDKLYRTWDGWSATTGRHIKEYCGLNKKQYLELECK